MPTTRKKVIKTVYKDEDDSEPEDPFSDSGSDAKISEESSSEEGEDQAVSSDDQFVASPNISKINKTRPRVSKPKFAKTLINRITKQAPNENDLDNNSSIPFSIKQMSAEDKLLPSVLNLSESDSSDDESAKRTNKIIASASTSDYTLNQSQCSDSDSENKTQSEYKDVWSSNTKESDEVARKAFLELAKHSSKIEETTVALQNYSNTNQKANEFDVNDLLAQGEEVVPKSPTPVKKKVRSKKQKNDSDSEVEDWEEVDESKSIPPQGLQLIVNIPDTCSRKTKKIDIEMMMKRKMNRVKKEYQVYMHKVHVLCWLGHGNFVSKVLNDQELLAASLSLVPGKECYPGARVDMKYVEQITTWYRDKFTIKQDKNENKYRPKAPPLKDILMEQTKSRVVTTKKYLVYIFVCMLRALGLQCRVMFNFVTLAIKPLSTELCSLKTIKEENISKDDSKTGVQKVNNLKKKTTSKKSQNTTKIPQVDGMCDDFDNVCDNYENIDQLDGNSDVPTDKRRSVRVRKQNNINSDKTAEEEDVSPPKRTKQSAAPKSTKSKQSSENKKLKNSNQNKEVKPAPKESSKKAVLSEVPDEKKEETKHVVSPRKTRNISKKTAASSLSNLPPKPVGEGSVVLPTISVTSDNQSNVSSKYFDSDKSLENKICKPRQARKRSTTTNPQDSHNKTEKSEATLKPTVQKRTRSTPGTSEEKSKYFKTDSRNKSSETKKARLSLQKPKIEKDSFDDKNRVSHKDLARKKPEVKKGDITQDLVKLVKGRIKETKEETKKRIVKGKVKKESDEDSDFLPEENPARRNSAESDDDFKPSKIISPKPRTNKKIDRRVLSSDDDTPTNKVDVWCEIFVEELEQWVPVDVVRKKTHCAESLYKGATHPVCYVVGWDNNNYLKDLTRRYVPHWNTVTRKQRAEPVWWNQAIQLWLGPKSARDREEDEQLDRMQLEAPLPKSIAEYKNHPLYALKRHLLKFEALYPSDAAVLGFVRSEPVYARECVYTCRSRETWLKEAKSVRLGEKPYKVVKARPKWDRLSNKLITDKPLEVFGPWQVQDYEPPEAENGIVPRNAYGNVELFKECMLPKGTVHIKLPGLNKVARKLNIDCAPAMTGFDFNGGWTHPVFDGFIVCKEFEDVITEAWVLDQEDQERKEQEKMEARVYGNWRKLIKGLFIRERLKNKYGFEEPSTSQDKKKPKGPRFVVKK